MKKVRWEWLWESRGAGKSPRFPEPLSGEAVPGLCSLSFRILLEHFGSLLGLHHRAALPTPHSISPPSPRPITIRGFGALQ